MSEQDKIDGQFNAPIFLTFIECTRKLLWVAFGFPFQMIGYRLMRTNSMHMTFSLERWVGEIHKTAHRCQLQLPLKVLNARKLHEPFPFHLPISMALLLEKEKYDGTELMSYTAHSMRWTLICCSFWSLIDVVSTWLNGKLTNYNAESVIEWLSDRMGLL